MFNVLDTFCGAGGFSLGFRLAGCRIVGGIEIDDWAAETFAFNHPESVVLRGDISKFTDDYLAALYADTKPDIILGGPPCQGFSICRKNAGDHRDPRNSLFQELLRLGRIFKPSVMIMENVPNLANARTGSGERVIEIICDELRNLGYYVYHSILEATDYGVPQIRKRLFVIASAYILERPFPQPTHFVRSETESVGQWSFFSDIPGVLEPCPTLWDAISDLPEIEARQGSKAMAYDKPAVNPYQYEMRDGCATLHNHTAMKHSDRLVRRFAAMSWGDSTSDVPEVHRPRKRNGAGELSGKVYDQNNRRMHPHKPCHTIAASFYANFVHPYKNRNFTPREGARIQAFPDNYVFLGKPTVVSHKLLTREARHDERHLCQYNQIGNAVPPLLARAIASQVLAQLARREDSDGVRLREVLRA